MHQGALDGFSGRSRPPPHHNGEVNELEPAPASRSAASQGLGFNLFGFPTRVDASFLLIVGLIGFDGSGSHLAIWVAVAVVSVLGHELGHALAARSMGATASITLAGLGGLTRSTRAQPLGRGESALLSAAGPLAGILLGLPVLYALRTLDWPSWTNGGFALRSAAFTTLGWSVLNLLPMLPLDGGHLLELSLPGTPAARRRLAAQLSIGIAAAAGYLAAKAGMQYGMFLALMFGAQNLAILKATPVQPEPPVLPVPPGQSEQPGQPGPPPGPPARRSVASILLEPVPPRRKPEGRPPVASPPVLPAPLTMSPPVVSAPLPASPPTMPESPPIAPEPGPPTGRPEPGPPTGAALSPALRPGRPEPPRAEPGDRLLVRHDARRAPGRVAAAEVLHRGAVQRQRLVLLPGRRRVTQLALVAGVLHRRVRDDDRQGAVVRRAVGVLVPGFAVLQRGRNG